MGILECRYCGAKAEAESFKEADSLIDHSRGKAIGRPCPGNLSDLLWDGKPAYKLEYVLLAKDSTPKPKAKAKAKPKPAPKPKEEEDKSSKTAL